MTCANPIPQPRRRLAAALLAAIGLAVAAIVVSGPAATQTAAVYNGVAPWQAERALADYLNRFLRNQKEYGLGKFGHANFVVRAKIDDLRRLDTPNGGVMWTAMFSGAILPTAYNDQAEQDYAQAVIRIYLDKDNGVQMVVNEGQRVTTQRARTDDLYRMLPETPGHWLDWGGPPPEPPSQTPIESGVPTLSATEPPPLPPSGVRVPTPGTPSVPTMSPQLQRLHDAYVAAKKRYEEAKRAPNTVSDPQKVYEQYKAAYEAWIKASQWGGVAALLLRATTSTRVTLVRRPLLQNG